MNQSETIDLIDSNGNLQRWSIADCKCYSLCDSATIYLREGIYVLRQWEPFVVGGTIAVAISHEQAVWYFLNAGQRSLGDVSISIRRHNNSKTQTRCKRRKKIRTVKGQYGLSGFANSQRNAVSRANSASRLHDSLINN
jgi:hypothetical protein